MSGSATEWQPLSFNALVVFRVWLGTSGWRATPFVEENKRQWSRTRLCYLLCAETELEKRKQKASHAEGLIGQYFFKTWSYTFIISTESELRMMNWRIYLTSYRQYNVKYIKEWINKESIVLAEYAVIKMYTLPFVLLSITPHNLYLTEQLCLTVNISWLVNANSLRRSQWKWPETATDLHRRSLE